MSRAKLLPLVLLVGCAGGGVGDEVVLSGGDGKADSLDGRVIKPEMTWRPGGFTESFGQSKVTAVDERTLEVEGPRFSFTTLRSLGEWRDETPLHVEIVNQDPDGARLGFLLYHGFYKIPRLECSHGAEPMNYFESVEIDIARRQIKANDQHVYTFEQCGVSEDESMWTIDEHRAWQFEVFPIPLSAAGKLDGVHDYEVSAILDDAPPAEEPPPDPGQEPAQDVAP